MRKLVKGIVTFRKNVQADYRETFAHLALGQSPDTLMIACSDSRVAPDVFASADPGDMFVVRNVGNLVAPCGPDGLTAGDESEPAAIEFAISALGVQDIIICGHSQCGAMRAVVDGIDKVVPVHLRSWLRIGEAAQGMLWKIEDEPRTLAAHDRLSQANVLQQIEHLKTYAIVHEQMRAGRLRLHAWWFDLAQADVCSYVADSGRFEVIDEAHAARILESLND